VGERDADTKGGGTADEGSERARAGGSSDARGTAAESPGVADPLANRGEAIKFNDLHNV
jgi:hypothetical protein